MAGNSTPYVKFLAAQVPSAHLCGAACGAWINATDPGNVCEAFTWYNASADSTLRGHCYGHTTVAWFPYPSPIAVSGRMTRPCQTDESCSLNGVCSAATGRCTCDPGWTGARCGMMKLLPVNRSRVGYREVSSAGVRTSSWGAGIIKEHGVEKWHAYVCVMTHSCGIGSWFANSAVVHAVSESPFGPFVKTAAATAAAARGGGDGDGDSPRDDAEVLYPAFSTNPTVTRGPQNQSVLVMGMGTANGSALPLSRQCNCSDGSTNRSCSAKRPSFFTNMAVGKATGGPFEPVFDVLGHRSWGLNFAVVINSDGSAVGATRLGFIRSTQYDNPKAWDNPVTTSVGLPEANVEDPYLWTDRRGNYHALFHAFERRCRLLSRSYALSDFVVLLTCRILTSAATKLQMRARHGRLPQVLGIARVQHRWEGVDARDCDVRVCMGVWVVDTYCYGS